MISLEELAQFLDRFFAVERYGDDQGGIFRWAARPVRRLGLALEPWPAIDEWAIEERLDAVFLHRPWQLESWQLPEIGVVAYHLAFDERLTIGFNPRLADALQLSAIETLGEKAGRPIGMVGAVPEQSFSDYVKLLNQIFGRHDEAQTAAEERMRRVAVVGAMTDALVREAADRGAQIYVTGQYRQPAREAVRETGIGVIAVGHRRSEIWGLRALAGVIRERWSMIEVIVAS
ncbi:MAG TPA: Nif3-like dinuclear metal center hexameric protein [Herpetosiphonaceae bacterium]